MLNLENADTVHLAPMLEEVWKPFLLGTKVSTKRIQRLFRSLYQQVQTGRFHLTQRALFQLPGVPTVAAASAFAPEFDLAGRQLNTLRLESDVTEVRTEYVASAEYYLGGLHLPQASSRVSIAVLCPARIVGPVGTMPCAQ
jgi:hypothetical protein